MAGEHEFGGFTATAHCKPEYNFAHNLRLDGSIFNQEHIGTGEHENWIGGDVTDPRTLFNQIFASAVQKYNDGQKRSDRKIMDYYQKVVDDGRFGKTRTLKIGNREKTVDTSKKPIYEFILQIGNRDERPDSQSVKPIMRDFVTQKWQELFGRNFRIVRADYHDDEYSEDNTGNYTIKSPAHVHVSFVPVVEKSPDELKGKGKFKLELQHSLSQACEQAGYTTDHLTDEERAIKNELKASLKKAKESGNKELKEQLMEQLAAYTTYTSQQRFEEAVRHSFAEYARTRGVAIDLTPRKKHGHQSKELFKINKEKERLENQKTEIEQEKKAVELQAESVRTEKTQLETEKTTFKERQKKEVQEISNRESAVSDRERNVDEYKTDLENWMAARKETAEFFKDFDFKNEGILLNDEYINQLDSPTSMEKYHPIQRSGLKRETHYEYAHRLVQTVLSWAKRKVATFQTKYSDLLKKSKSLHRENLFLTEKFDEFKKITTEELQRKHNKEISGSLTKNAAGRPYYSYGLKDIKEIFYSIDLPTIDSIRRELSERKLTTVGALIDADGEVTDYKKSFLYRISSKARDICDAAIQKARQKIRDKNAPTR